MRILSWCSEGGCHVDQRAAVAAPPKPVGAAPPAYVNRTPPGYKPGLSSAHPEPERHALITPTEGAVQSGPLTGGVTGPPKGPVTGGGTGPSTARALYTTCEGGPFSLRGAEVAGPGVDGPPEGFSFSYPSKVRVVPTREHGRRHPGERSIPQVEIACHRRTKKASSANSPPPPRPPLGGCGVVEPRPLTVFPLCARVPSPPRVRMTRSSCRTR